MRHWIPFFNLDRDVKESRSLSYFLVQLLGLAVGIILIFLFIWFCLHLGASKRENANPQPTPSGAVMQQIEIA